MLFLFSVELNSIKPGILSTCCRMQLMRACEGKRGEEVQRTCGGGERHVPGTVLWRTRWAGARFVRVKGTTIVADEDLEAALFEKDVDEA